ncbi:uncharacterized protein LOC133792244 [Humulus lupulus]|uniref:uncharacterized protein LOC133792244 n=1 Tax=Humulus lupulus TaxID=3486 RepID=UPI002B410C88|nr:uncharacterized protein LOC133792244 [Humulus lupulus]
MNEVRNYRQFDHEDNLDEMIDDAYYESEVDLVKIENLLSEAEKPIYSGCTKFTKLSAFFRLYNMKAKKGWSDMSFTELWQKKRNSEEDKEGVPTKVLWYIPPIPNLIRFYRNVDHAKNLTWHANMIIKDGRLRHPTDLPAWKSVDCEWPSFSNEPRNIRVALSTSGINPHTSLSSKYSCWSVMLVIYNLPPWLYMKRKFTLLTLLISGPKQPGNDIEFYLASLIDDLKTLLNEGVRAYDAYLKEEFTLRVMLLWKINDFPTYGNLSGCSVKGYKDYPICEEKTFSQYLKHSRKVCYMGHRKFFPRRHYFRTWKNEFSGGQEFGLAPVPLSGNQVLNKVSVIQFKVGKPIVCPIKKKKGRGKSVGKDKTEVRMTSADESKSPWKKKSIFFELEYWENLLLRHNLDVMHIEKNVYDSLIGTLLNIPSKSKDEYLHGVTSVGDQSTLNKSNGGYGGKGSVVCSITQDERHEALCLVLQNIDEIQPYIEDHFVWIRKKYPSKSKNQKWIQDEHYRTFSTWLENKVAIEVTQTSSHVSNIVKWISRGPSLNVFKYPSYIVNGTQFNTLERDNVRTTQNSGVCIVAKIMQISSSKDQNLVECDMTFYGVIQEFWELDYITNRVLVFLCDWVKSDKGVKVDDLGFTSIDLNRIWHKNDHLIMETQAKLVFYVNDPSNKQWSVVVPTQLIDWRDKENDLTEYPIDDGVDDDDVCLRFDGDDISMADPGGFYDDFPLPGLDDDCLLPGLENDVGQEENDDNAIEDGRSGRGLCTMPDIAKM